MASENGTLGVAELRLQPETTSPAKARRFGLDAAHRWHIAIDEDALAIVLSEMVTDAVENADDPVMLRLRPAATYLEVQVDDGTGSAFGGEHMRLVDILADASGFESLGGGKRAWCRLSRVRT
jgi:hypothetical protein